MRHTQIERSDDSCLRFVFDDAVLSFDIAVNATYADIAQALRKLSSQHHDIPVAIDVTFALARTDARRSRVVRRVL